MSDISPIDFYKLYSSIFKIKIIDLRESYDFDHYHIKGSINIPYSLIIKKHFLFLNKKYHYYVICKDGSLSKKGALYLSSIGYNITNVIGGLKAWRGRLVYEEVY